MKFADIIKDEKMKKNQEPIRRAKEVLKIEAQSILRLIDKIDGNFSKAVDAIYKSKGRVIITGIGKSGLIGRKIVATLTSTGTQAIFLHPVEGIHGDLGIVTKKDILLAINSYHWFCTSYRNSCHCLYRQSYLDARPHQRYCH
jgi:arabinose-5-phosphate isomerase